MTHKHKKVPPQEISRCAVIKFQLKKWWKPMFSILVPAVCSLIFMWHPELKDNDDKLQPIPQAPAAAYSIFVMALYWISECIPLSITALLPVVIFPLFDIMDTEQVTVYYMGNSVMMLLAGCIIALAFEYSNFHTRIALKVLLIVGSQIPRLLLGILLTAMFLSMWMNNTSTTAMMVPIVNVIMVEFEKAYMNNAVRAKNARLQRELAEKLKELSVNNISVMEIREASDIEVDSDVNIDGGFEDGVPVKKSELSNAISKASITSDVTSKGSLVSLSELSPEELKAKNDVRNIQIMFLLAVAWGSNIGGTGVTIGTAPNVLTQAALDKFVEDNKAWMKDGDKCADKAKITFLNWMMFAFFPMILSLLATWIILYFYKRGIPSCLKCKGMWRKCRIMKPETPHDMEERLAGIEVANEINQNIKKAIRAKYEQLGSMTLHEILVVTVFFLMAILWVTGSSLWWQWFWKDIVTGREKKDNVHDLIPGLLVSLLLFILPKDKKYYQQFCSGGFWDGIKDPLLKWHLVQVDIPWGPLILIGGGSAISGGIKHSKLGDWLGEFLKSNQALNDLETWQYLTVIVIITAILTAIASNTATISMLIPVLLNLAYDRGIHPFYLLVVPTISCSFAFMLPISTPPNAIVFDKSDMRQMEMAIPGFFVTVVSNAILILCTHSINNAIFKFDDYNNNKELAYCSAKS